MNAADIASEGLDDLAWEILAYPNLDDFEGLTTHLLRCGYSITAIGATRLDALIDEARCSRISLVRPQ